MLFPSIAPPVRILKSKNVVYGNAKNVRGETPGMAAGGRPHLPAGRRQKMVHNWQFSPAKNDCNRSGFALYRIRDRESFMSPDTPGTACAARQWSVVLQARRQDTARAMEALARLCQTYWYPLYAYVRLRGHSPEEAKELTHEFFSRLLQNKTLAYMKRDCGKFRSFLLSAMNHFLVDEARKGRVAKPEAPADVPLSEKLFEQNWALTVGNVVYDRLKREYDELGKGELFAALKHCLASSSAAVSYAELASRLSLAENAVKNMVQSLRQRYGDLLREEMANVVATPAELEEELRSFLSAAGAA
jgi:DNA-directed RNA polymerase specialized sigma24 family protein